MEGEQEHWGMLLDRRIAALENTIGMLTAANQQKTQEIAALHQQLAQVNQQLGLKMGTATVNQRLVEVNQQLGLKADTAAADQELGLKMDTANANQRLVEV